ncbi:SDR family NAD(P)-dependent oxidoreductase [Sphingomicrobium lutaoense]|uniref:NAD(P)-dependent dehydrogenase (Short-subunit alcohol dehydrogenase family) n=1 Tax=Sphingomicrobium lutaoense TaxID=515949 RepID=A0A839Z1D1_9SPHN|nr:SDR family oxidoreductase [Sphingomicrobium lutaoense]MBB3763482.1 NAD(P)-dependent dehydrogenase (short-subunit alcohol dehydrogenase family) [Sphingomicrobium lutaoense]
MKILITGAASGIGKACADHYRERGADLVLVDRTAGNGIVEGDVSDPSLWEGLDLSGLTHAVVNAGIGDAAPVHEMPFEKWRRVMQVNLDGAFLTLRAALRAIDRGAIVITASATAIKPTPMTGAYGASKAAVAHLARIAAAENARRGVRVNVIAPGGVDTAIWDGPIIDGLVEKLGSRKKAIAAMGADIPVGRFATPEEIARQIGMLLEEETITGTMLVSDGGFTL